LANKKHLTMLKKGIDVWNKWRQENPSIEADLRGADLVESNLINANLSGSNLSGAILSGANLNGANLKGADLRFANLSEGSLFQADFSGANLNNADFSGANLFKANLFQSDLRGATIGGANLSGANLFEADLREANLSGANLTYANLYQANLSGANLSEANLPNAELSGANLSNSDLSGSNLSGTRMVKVNLKGAILTGSRVFGVSAWGIAGLKEAEQSNLTITSEIEPVITVDNLEVAQFIYILLHSEKIRDVIDTITSKAVLILGRFTPERKAILDAIREELRKQHYLPILFDFPPPESKDVIETISTLAHMAKFIIADITDAKSVPQELESIIPHLPTVPVQPILHVSATEYGTFEHCELYDWVLETYRYNDLGDLLKNLKEKIIDPAIDKSNQQQKKLIRKRKKD
jgi:uncharacterized protein YjbI with pentapeptide repeats